MKQLDLKRTFQFLKFTSALEASLLSLSLQAGTSRAHRLLTGLRSAEESFIYPHVNLHISLHTSTVTYLFMDLRGRLLLIDESES